MRAPMMTHHLSRMSVRLAGVSLAALVATGCTVVGPDYEKPGVTPPEAFRFQSQAQGGLDKEVKSRWDLHRVPFVARIRSIFARMGRKMKLRLLMGALLCLCVFIFYHSRKWTSYRQTCKLRC